MRKIVQWLLLKPILWFIRNFTSAPNRERIFTALTQLKDEIENKPGEKGYVVPFKSDVHRYIIFSDQHKGRKNGADDFMVAEPSYLAALEHYNSEGFHFISLGDCEELWENTAVQVMKFNKASFAMEKKFIARNAFTKIFGNHDLDWDIDPLAAQHLEQMYSTRVPVLEGIVLQTSVSGKMLSIMCTHGHQGDLQSDGNWFSKFFVSKIWAPLQAYLKINFNTPANDRQLKTIHNRLMYEWSSQQTNLLLITGHTHQPVFESLTRAEREYRDQRKALADSNPEWSEAIENEISWQGKESEAGIDYLKMKPTYFNSGCCCFADGDITGIEIVDGSIKLIRWKYKNNRAERQVLSETSLAKLMERL